MGKLKTPYQGKNLKIPIESDLDRLSDVTITSPADKELLAYDSESGKWINQTAGAAGVVPSTTKEITIYVDPSGSDTTGDGSSSAPFATVQKALDWYRDNATVIAHHCKIAIGKGTYTLEAPLDFSGLIIPASLTIEARDTSDNALYDNGTATGGTSTTLQDTTKAWLTDFWAGAWVYIYRGTGAGQYQQISSNTADTLTVSSAWDTTPDSTSEYVIVSARLDGATNSLENAILLSAIDNVRIYGLYFDGFTSYAISLIGTWGWDIQKNLVVSSSGRGIAFTSGRTIAFRYNFIHVAAYGVYVGYGAGVTLYHNLIKAQTAGSGYGIYVTNGGQASMSASASYKNTIQDWDIGIYARFGGVSANGSVQIFSGNTTDYSPSAATDPAYIS